MRFIRTKLSFSRVINCLLIIASCMMFWATCIVPVIATETKMFTCRQKLSTKGAMIFDNVQRKRTSDSNLEEIWKEETRDLITANVFGREEATKQALEALNCLRVAE